MFDVADDTRLAEAIALRIRVFVDEQKVPLALEIDEHDRPGSTALHAIVREADGTVVGVGRLYRRDAATAQIGRMAVAASARGRGVGAALLRRLVAEAERLDFTTARLDAQDHALGFYGRERFNVAGDAFLDAGIVHVPMVRTLARPVNLG